MRTIQGKKVWIIEWLKGIKKSKRYAFIIINIQVN